MIHSKNNGFTLIEVLMATAMVGIVLTPIYSIQSSVMDRVFNMTQAVQRMFVAFDFFLEAQKDEDDDKKKITKKSDDPVMDLTYEIVDMPKDSELHKSFNNLYIEKTTWQWQGGRGKKSNVFINILFEPPEPEKKKEEGKQEALKKEASSEKAKPPVPVSAEKLPRASKSQGGKK